ncbi:MAG: translation initiation factor IF-2 [Candidatus Pacebacteria bacterium]|nr:translation initiation factor IF-2 [Candidatus Paceibacterota bacterium]
MNKNKDTKKDSAGGVTERPPVVAVMGHIDHGKSTLLDYIRKTNIVDREAGGITQAVSAYEVLFKGKKITFIDTPGHAAFTKMRERSANVADIAILVVSAEDGVKPQTVEAWKTITESNTPFIVAINKIDKPEASIEKTKVGLAENGIYLENYGGNIPFVPISAKAGTNIDELLSMIELIAEVESFTGNSKKLAEGFVIEANMDPKRGIQATLIIKDGYIDKTLWASAGGATCKVRIMEDFLGKSAEKMSFSSPLRLVGFDQMPKVGAPFKCFDNKDEASAYAKSEQVSTSEESFNFSGNKKVIPVILKADTTGSIEAIEKEISKIKNDSALFRIVQKGEGKITEGNIKSISDGEEALVIGFNVKADNSATELAERRGVKIAYFDIIYKLSEWLEKEMEARRPRVETEETVGRAKILKAFSKTKEKQVLGAKVVEGKISLSSMVKIIRRENAIGQGKIVNLEKNKMKVGSVEEGTEFGMMLESKLDIVPGDVIETFAIVKR